jgi:hypothetical protein
VPSRRQLICDAIVAKLGVLPGVTARWLHDGELDESTESTTPMAVVVPGSDSITGTLNRSVQRELLGHIIFETTVGVPMNATSRATADAQLSAIEGALLQLSADTDDQAQQPGMPISRTVPGVTEFEVLELQTTFDGGATGRFAARIDWVCRYRHDSTDPSSFTGVA